MDINSVPEPTWKAGPESSTNEKRGWREALEDAEDQIRDAKRMYRDNVHTERMLRIQCIDEAIQLLQEAKVRLPNQVVHVG
jgi:hypothetical protein